MARAPLGSAGAASRHIDQMGDKYATRSSQRASVGSGCRPACRPPVLPYVPVAVPRRRGHAARSCTCVRFYCPYAARGLCHDLQGCLRSPRPVFVSSDFRQLRQQAGRHCPPRGEAFRKAFRDKGAKGRRRSTRPRGSGAERRQRGQRGSGRKGPAQPLLRNAGADFSFFRPEESTTTSLAHASATAAMPQPPLGLGSPFPDRGPDGLTRVDAARAAHGAMVHVAA